MRVLQINSVAGIGSTGRIVVDLSKTMSARGIENIILYGDQMSNYPLATKIGSQLNVKTHIIKTRLLGKHAFYSKRVTRKFISAIEQFKPDLIHLHNVHGHYLNVEILFNYLARRKTKVIWTLHDCWSFTGHCAFYDYIKCDKWKTHCEHCPGLRNYPTSLIFDRSYEAYDHKKQLFNRVDELKLVTPSKWLATEVAQSYLKEQKIIVIHNGIDLGTFKPTDSNVKAQYQLTDKFVILGVASIWEPRKGLEYFMRLSAKLNHDEVIVLVGLSQEQKSKLPKNIIGITRTNSIEELAALYTASDVFVNPTLEDNYPTTNLEAMSCGTPVITFNTGGSPESVDEQTGIVVSQGDEPNLLNAIRSIKAQGKQYYRAHCLNKAKMEFDKNINYARYIELYEAMCK